MTKKAENLPIDPFADISKLRLSQDFSAGAAVKKILNTVRVGKPNRHEFVRVRKSEEGTWQLTTMVLKMKQEREETFIVDRRLWDELASEIRPVTIYTAITRQNNLFLWVVNMPTPDGRDNDWARTSREAAEMAKQQWVRVSANMGLGAYEIHVPVVTDLPEPKWPDEDFLALLRIGFRGVGFPIA